MAAQFKACAVDGCKGNAHYRAKGCRGWCARHYDRVRKHGDPSISLSPWGEAQAWIERYRDHDGEACLTWPFSRNPAGYGYVHHQGKTRLAHRLICAAVHGEPERPALDAAHSCGSGHEGCVNPRHLRWDTRSGNFADMVEHGTVKRGERNPLAKLTAANIAEIRALRGHLSQSLIGKRFGIDQSTVSLIQRGKSWGWLT